MEVTKANELARNVARYIRHHPRDVELSKRVRHITHGQDLDEADVQQVTRKVSRLLAVPLPPGKRVPERRRKTR